jgi:hypothetical protein
MEDIIDGVILPSEYPIAEVMVPVLDRVPFIDSNASARSNTLPLNIELYDALWGVDGTVACTAGPNAALAGVIARGVCDPGDCNPYCEPLTVPLDGFELASRAQGEDWIKVLVSLIGFSRGFSNEIISLVKSSVIGFISFTFETRL